MPHTRESLLERVRALPADQRDAILGPLLPSIAWSTELIDMFPSAALVRALLAGSEANTPRWLSLVEQMRALGKKHETVREAVEAIVAATPKPSIELYVTSILSPKDETELTELQKEQLRIGLRGYEEAFDLEPEERLPSDGTPAPLPPDLQIRTIASAEGRALYDSFTYMADAGILFEAGTTEEVGGIAQCAVVLIEKNDALRNALQVALSNVALHLAGHGALAAPSAVSRHGEPAGGALESGSTRESAPIIAGAHELGDAPRGDGVLKAPREKRKPKPTTRKSSATKTAQRLSRKK